METSTAEVEVKETQEATEWWNKQVTRDEKIELTRLYFPAFGYHDLSVDHIKTIFDKTTHLRNGIR